MTDVANINDVFWTIQGEGQNWGRRSLFVRMPFCNLACSWCDTSFNTYTKWSKQDLQMFAQQETARFAVITGGEPSMNVHTPRVIEWLNELNFEIAIESNGTHEIPQGIEYITISPKRDADYFVHENNWSRVNEFKYVVDDGFDFTILDRHDPEEYPTLTLSPEFNNFDKNVEQIINYIKENPRWRISLQTHKFMKVK